MKPETEKTVSLMILVIIGLFILSFLLPNKCVAQTKAVYDTIPCRPECMVKLVSTTSDKGKTKFQVVYKDQNAGIEELISISQSVIDYIGTCTKNGLKPTLGIKLRNGNITSIIRIRKRYAVRKQ